jgi:multidrug efflux pump subunit AcrA (membrane-fusion protein)
MAGPRIKCAWGLSLLALLTACGKEGPKEPLSPRVYIQEVTSRDYAPPIALSGDIQARVETQPSFRVGGKIIERKVDVGDHIQANQVLARLDPKDLNPGRDRPGQRVCATGASGTNPRRLCAPAKAAAKRLHQPERIRCGLCGPASAQSALAAAQAQLANAREQLSYSNLVAEAPGIITERQAEVGQVVQATMPMFSLARDGARDAVFNVRIAVYRAAQRPHSASHPVAGPDGQSQRFYP